MTNAMLCPFCGGAVSLHQGHADITYIGCDDGCGAVVSFRPHLKGTAAIEKWNTRVQALSYSEVEQLAIKYTRLPLALLADCSLCGKQTESTNLHKMIPPPRHTAECPLRIAP